MAIKQISFSIIFLLSSSLAIADEAPLAVWANEAIVSTYTFNYQNFMDRQKEIALYFTAQGWMNYSKALNASKLPDTIQKNKFYVSSVAISPPEIKNLAPNNWQATMPLLVVYKNPQYQQQQNLQVTIQFTVAPSGQGVRGYAINSLQTIVKEPACSCRTNPFGS